MTKKISKTRFERAMSQCGWQMTVEPPAFGWLMIAFCPLLTMVFDDYLVSKYMICACRGGSFSLDQPWPAS